MQELLELTAGQDPGTPEFAAYDSDEFDLDSSSGDDLDDMLGDTTADTASTVAPVRLPPRSSPRRQHT